MQDDDKNTNQLTHAQRKLIDYSVAIFSESATSKEAAYMARQLVQITLPHKNPGDVPAWSRRNGNITLTIRPGWNSKKQEVYGYPYGTIPRLLLFWIITEAIRTKNHRLELGNSLNGFMAELGLSSYTGRGKRGDVKRLRDQMQRLFNALISFEGDIPQDGRKGEARLNMVVASETMLWWSEKDPEQGALWGSWVELGDKFYQAIIATPVPVDMRALLALKKSPLALDLYAWLVYEAFRSNNSGNPRFETWEQLHSHLGGEYNQIGDFRRKAKAAITKSKVVYPGLRLGTKQGGIEVLPESLPALQPRGITIEGTATPIPTAESPTQQKQARNLKPRTVERFRAIWGRLHPYACQAAFDAWIDEKPTEREPKYYDAAFMGWAEKWAVGKL
jgi:hypothetical protein